MIREPPKTAKGRATRERIVGCAAELVALNGVAATSLDDVRAAAHASKSQLYHYFADREELLRAVVAATSDAVLAAQDDYFGRLDTLAGIEAWMDALVARQEECDAHGELPLGSLAGQLAECDEGAREAIGDALDRWESEIRAGLAAMAARGELAGDPARLATQVMAAVQGGLLLTQVRRDPEQLRASLDGALALLRAAK